jgi:membrane fusion protein, multidrug efflux system
MNTSDKPPAAQAPDAPKAPRPSQRKWWVALILLLLAGGIFYAVKQREATAASGVAGGGGGGGGGRRGGLGGGPVPVSSVAAAKGDLRIYLSALGSVTALNTITVKSRVDGELQKINFAEGQPIKAGDTLAEIDPRQFRIALEQAEGQLARDMALLSNARLDLERYVNAKEAVTEQQLDTAKSTVAQFEGTVRTDQATVDNDRLQLSYCTITAPLTGRVGLRMVDEGNLIRATDAGLVVITQEEPIAVVFSIPEDNLPQIRKSLADGQELAVDAYDRSLTTKLATGALVAVDNQIDSTTGTVRLKALFPNEDHGLFPNQFVNVRMLTEVQEGVTLIPNAAIQLNAQARYVFVVKADSTVERRTVTVGKTEGERTAIVDGLAVGEVVVTEGLDRLSEGAKVTTRSLPPAGPAGPGGGRRGKKGGDGSAPGERRGKRPDGASPSPASPSP